MMEGIDFDVEDGEDFDFGADEDEDEDGEEVDSEVGEDGEEEGRTTIERLKEDLFAEEDEPDSSKADRVHSDASLTTWLQI
jgi:U3 small nucleolar RNA-associated protein MPP10